MPELSDRQLEVLGLMRHGHANKEIGQLLGIAERTVKAHVTEILRRLRAANRTQAVVEAMRRGLLPYV